MPISATSGTDLPDVLVEGVEHTRAAREFLKSLIDLEKAFHEQMLFEQRATLETAPEKIAVLEMMKKRFYDGLYQRMERFFGTPHGEQA